MSSDKIITLPVGNAASHIDHLPVSIAPDPEPRSARKRWSLEEKRSLAELTMQPGSTVPEVAQTFGLAPSQLSCWRRLLADGGLVDPVEKPVFARVQMEAEPAARRWRRGQDRDHLSERRAGFHRRGGRSRDRHHDPGGA